LVKEVKTYSAVALNGRQFTHKSKRYYTHVVVVSDNGDQWAERYCTKQYTAEREAVRCRKEYENVEVIELRIIS